MAKRTKAELAERAEREERRRAESWIDRVAKEKQKARAAAEKAGLSDVDAHVQRHIKTLRMHEDPAYLLVRQYFGNW